MNEILQKIPFLRLTLAFSSGIGLATVFQLEWKVLIIPVISLLLLLMIHHRYFSYRTAALHGVLLHLFFFASGMLVSARYQQRPVFYSGGSFCATVSEIPVEKTNSFQAVVYARAVFRNDTVFAADEKIMVWFEKGPKAAALIPGDRILFERRPQQITNRNNPFEFDYKGYLAGKRIFRSVFLQHNQWEKSGQVSAFSSLFILARRVRLRLLSVFQSQNLDPNSFHILSALTLGYKRGLDPETKRIFSSAGAMHVLAVSGLHVGIVYIVLNGLLGFLKRQKSGRWIFVGCVILVLWFYAFITGLSPSVTRASAMFSMMVIGQNIRRQVNVYNSLAASAFLLLLFNPHNLFEVGFQLSYSAVFGIIFLQPRLAGLLYIKNRVLHYFWALLTVSVAAQVATFPFSLFYFHQFPVYFWITNLAVIPAVTLLIPLGMGLLLFHTIPVVSFILSKMIAWMLQGIYFLLQSVEQLPHSVIELTLLPGELAGIALMLLGVFTFVHTRHPFCFKLVLASLVFVVVSASIAKYRNHSRKAVIIYNHSENRIVHLISGTENFIVSEKPLTRKDHSMRLIENTILNYRLGPGHFFTLKDSVANEYLFMDNGFLAFEGKIFFFGEGFGKLPSEIFPEVIFGELPRQTEFPGKMENTLFVSQGRFSEAEDVLDLNIHYLGKNGAFRSEW